MEEFWGKISAVHFELKEVQCSESVFVCWWFLLVLDPQALCSTNKCFRVPFSLCQAWLSLNKVWPGHWPSLPLWQRSHRKYLQTMYTNLTPLAYLTLLPDDKRWSRLCPENPWWPLIILTSESVRRMYPGNWMYLILHWYSRHKLFLYLPWTALSWKYWGK